MIPASMGRDQRVDDAAPEFAAPRQCADLVYANEAQIANYIGGENAASLRAFIWQIRCFRAQLRELRWPL
jgi:hypothetical protein